LILGRHGWRPSRSEGRPDEGLGIRISRLFAPYRGRLAAVLALIAVSAGLGMISPFLLRDVLDEAIPKDGPSAGITMTTALASLLSGRPIKHTVGMTGEVTLQGRVLPIGGLKQKVLAAHAAGLTDVILPERNRGDLDDVPEDVREQMTFHPVMSIDEVLDFALEPAPLEAVA
jgi:predicted S18 family serine protease